eukprot:scaffold176621_cov21-Tisochrysis_lutea.AAC.1
MGSQKDAAMKDASALACKECISLRPSKASIPQQNEATRNRYNKIPRKEEGKKGEGTHLLLGPVVAWDSAVLQLDDTPSQLSKLLKGPVWMQEQLAVSVSATPYPERPFSCKFCCLWVNTVSESNRYQSTHHFERSKWSISPVERCLEEGDVRTTYSPLKSSTP